MWNDIVFINKHFPTVHLLCIQKVNHLDKNILHLKNCILKIKTHFSECLNSQCGKSEKAYRAGTEWAFFSYLVTSKGDKQNILFLNKLHFTFIEQSFQNASSLTDGNKMEEVCVLSPSRSDCIQWVKYRMDIFL